MAVREPDEPWRVRRASRIIEIGDARFLAAGREVDVTGAVIVPALTASVRGLGARWWLTARALEDMARLGVGTVRWHVPLRDVGRAQVIAAQRAGPARPSIAVVAATAPASRLVLTRAPRRPPSRSLAHALDALGAWRAPSLPVASALALLTEPKAAGPPPVALTRDAPASFLVLRGGGDAAIDPGALQVESVFIDGREMGAPSRAPR